MRYFPRLPSPLFCLLRSFLYYLAKKVFSSKPANKGGCGMEFKLVIPVVLCMFCFSTYSYSSTLEKGISFRKKVVTSRNVSGKELTRVDEYTVYLTKDKMKVVEITAVPSLVLTRDTYRRSRNDIRRDNRYVILRMDREKFWEVNPKYREYRELSFMLLVRRGFQKDMMRDVIFKRVEDGRKMGLVSVNITDGIQKDMITNMRDKATKETLGALLDGGANKAAIQMRRTTRFQDILGYKCRLYEVWQGRELLVQAWITNDIEVGRNFMDKLQYFKKFQTAIENELRKEVRGFPMRIKYKTEFFLEGNSIRSHVDVTEDIVEINNATFKDKFFEPPAGYSYPKQF